MPLSPLSVSRGYGPTLSALHRALLHTLLPQQGHCEAPNLLHTGPNVACEMHIQQWRAQLAELARLSEDFNPAASDLLES